MKYEETSLTRFDATAVHRIVVLQKQLSRTQDYVSVLRQSTCKNKVCHEHGSTEIRFLWPMYSLIFACRY